MPKGDWNAGTKQGIYMMGPNAEYLEGRFAASGEPADIRARLQRALDRWQKLKSERAYADKPIPPKAWSPPPGIEGELVFRVSLRDLPRGNGDRSGVRRHELPESGMWRDFVRWAWNENWIALASASMLVPKGNDAEAVDSVIVNRIAREVIVDNVRGQAPAWQPGEVVGANLTMKRLDTRTIEYTGEVDLRAGGRSIVGKIYGRGTWTGKSFESLDLVMLGMRRGASRFNQRENDPGPASIGITLSLKRQ
ncbi:MAG: hypothetical protein HONBIEJF_00995 [Fimbriimonadaceae bacterium]|nr:hypothetical protein [Fimbriimonadaceae bacterium]